MIYEAKIDWKVVKPHAGLLSVQDEFKTVVLDYQIGVEGELEDIIRRHLRNPAACKTKYIPFERRIEWVQALIGKTPDDEIWGVVKSLGKLRNQFAHSKVSAKEAGKKKVEKLTIEIFNQIATIRPSIRWRASPPDRLDILAHAHLIVQRFFGEINEGLDRQGLPKSTTGGGD